MPADDYVELHRRGYTERQIAKRVGKSPGHIHHGRDAVAAYPGKQDRPEFQVAYDQAKSGSADPVGDEWYTPHWLFDALGVRFDLDVCRACRPNPRLDPGQPLLHRGRRRPDSTVGRAGLVQPAI